MMSSMLLAGVFAFAAVALAAAAVQRSVFDARNVHRTLRSVPGAVRLPSAGVGGSPRAQGPLVSRLAVPALARLGRAVERSSPTGLVRRLRRDLDLAGNPPGWDAERVLATKALLGGSLPAAAIALSTLAGAPVFRSVVLAVGLGGLGFLGPDMLLARRIRSRQDEIRLALPDCLDLLSLTVEAGLAFDGALARVGRQVGGALGQELHRVVQEMQLGRARADALRALAERSTVEEVRSFVLAMVQADIFGIAIGRVLDVQAHEMRVKRRQRAEERAQKVPVKIVFPVLFCIFPALFVVLLGPAAITIWQTMFRL